jgi:hypothetical protein
MKNNIRYSLYLVDPSSDNDESPLHHRLQALHFELSARFDFPSFNGIYTPKISVAYFKNGHPEHLARAIHGQTNTDGTYKISFDPDRDDHGIFVNPNTGSFGLNYTATRELHDHVISATTAAGKKKIHYNNDIRCNPHITLGKLSPDHEPDMDSWNDKISKIKQAIDDNIRQFDMDGFVRPGFTEWVHGPMDNRRYLFGRNINGVCPVSKGDLLHQYVVNGASPG